MRLLIPDEPWKAVAACLDDGAGAREVVGNIVPWAEAPICHALLTKNFVEIRVLDLELHSHSEAVGGSALPCAKGNVRDLHAGLSLKERIIGVVQQRQMI